MEYCRLLLFYIFIILQTPVANALQGGLVFRTLDNRDGLSHNSVFCAMQDSRGFVWFGTAEGLNRYDGKNLRVFKNFNGDKDNVLSNKINYIHQSQNGLIWIFTDGGTAYYDYTKGKFEPFAISDGERNYTLFCSAADDENGNIWFTSYGEVIRYNPTTKRTKVFEMESWLFSKVKFDESGQLLVNTYNNIYRFDPQSDEFCATPLLKNNLSGINDFCVVSSSTLLIATKSDGVVRADRFSGQWEMIIEDVYARTILPYGDSQYWIGTETGLFIYDISLGSYRYVKKSLTNDTYSLADNSIYSIVKDSEGGVWVSTFFGGVSHYSPQYSRFEYAIAGKTHSEMLGNSIREIVPDSYGNLWIGTEDNGVNKYNVQSDEFTNFSATSPHNKISATNIHGLLVDGDHLWIGTYDKGIDVMDIRTQRVVRRYTQDKPMCGLNSDFVLCFEKLDDGTLLVGTTNGVQKFDPQTESFSEWAQTNSLVRQIHQDSSGNVWMASANGPYAFLKQENQLKQFGAHNGITDVNITSIFEDSRGVIWVSALGGIYKYDKAREQFSRVNFSKQPPSSLFYRIVQQDSGDIFWISSANGMIRYNAATNQTRIYGVKNGMHESQFNFCSSFKSPEGTLYFGTIKGLMSFDPEEIAMSSPVPPLYFTEIVFPGNSKETIDLQSIPENRIELSHQNSTFTLSFIALSYVFSDAIEYSYRIAGQGEEWNYIGANPNITFNSLPAGDHQIIVRATDNQGEWQGNHISILITIIPPLWASTFAMVLYALIVLGAVLLFIESKKRKMRRKRLAEQRAFQDKKDRELYQEKMKFFTFITHEIMTPITLVVAPLERVIEMGEGGEQTKQYLGVMKSNLEKLLTLSKQILDLRRMEVSDHKLHATPTDVRAWLLAKIEPYLSLAEHNQKQISVVSCEGSQEALIDRDAISKILDNLLSNAIKYSHTAINITINVSVERMSFVVENDGELIPVADRENIFLPFYRVHTHTHRAGSGVGLYLCRCLVEQHKGELLYGETLDGLNQFSLSIPIVVDSDSQKIEGRQEVEEHRAVNVTPSDSNYTVLIVEDHDELRSFMCQELYRNYNVLSASNGQQALEMIASNSVDFVVSDVMMPVVDGYELCSLLKNSVETSHIPVILLTAQRGARAHIKGLGQGANAYLQKPFLMEVLVAQIENIRRTQESLSRLYVSKPSTEITAISTNEVDSQFLEKLNDFILENLINDKLSVETIASHVGMSASSLYRKVKSLVGVSPVELIRITRLKRAVELMQKGESRMNIIALEVGFSSDSYFSTCFQNQYGKTPKELFREIHKLQ